MSTHTHAHGAHAHGHPSVPVVNALPAALPPEAVSWLMRSVAFRLLGAGALCAFLAAAMVWALSVQG